MFTIYCKEEILINGELHVLGHSSTIQAQNLSNAGEITSTSCLSIECEKVASNIGNVICNGNITIKSEDLSNENGVIMASPNIHIEMSSCKDTVLSGQL